MNLFKSWFLQFKIYLKNIFSHEIFFFLVVSGYTNFKLPNGNLILIEFLVIKNDFIEI
jgi:hypothetical protein